MNCDELAERIKKLTADLAEAEAALPAHTIRPQQMQRVMQLEEELAEAEEQYKELGCG